MIAKIVETKQHNMIFKCKDKEKVTKSKDLGLGITELWR
jgi:hypothetical protein